MRPACTADKARRPCVSPLICDRHVVTALCLDTCTRGLSIQWIMAIGSFLGSALRRSMCNVNLWKLPPASLVGFENDASVETWIIADCGIVTRGQAIDELYNAAVQRKIEDGEEDVATTMPLMNCENKVTFSERSYAHCSMYRYVQLRPFDSILGMSYAHYPLPDQALSRRCIQGCMIA